VDVTKMGSGGTGVSSETLTQALRLRHAIKRIIQILFIRKLYFENIGSE